MTQYIDKSALVAEIEKELNSCNLIQMGNDYINVYEKGREDVCNKILSFIDTLEVKEVDLKQKSFVKIDRKLLFEICDAILNHDGYSDVNDCPENDSECYWGKWDEGFRKKVENIRKNS